MNKIQEEDVQQFARTFPLKDSLKDSTFLITGATGLIGSTLIHCLLALKAGTRIVAPVRNMQKASQLFSKEEQEGITFVSCDLQSTDFLQFGAVDYIVHCAAPTSSSFFVSHPVETFDSIIEITRHLLSYARQTKPKGFLYLSSLEVYGTINDDSVMISEEVQGYLDPLSVRSSYPMAKRAAETLCHLYAQEYGLPITIARLTQTTGAGIAADDNRVIAQFARLAARCENIILHTTGESARPYCYTTDSISAMLHILLKGEGGAAYNVANEDTYISARGMAEYLQKNFSPEISIHIQPDSSHGYAPATKQRLSTQRLQALGWKPQYGLKEIFERLIASME